VAKVEVSSELEVNEIVITFGFLENVLTKEAIMADMITPRDYLTISELEINPSARTIRINVEMETHIVN